MSLSTTTLGAALDRFSAEGYLASVSGVYIGTVLSIDTEILRVTGFGAGLIVKFQRGTDGTSAVAHSSGATVNIGTPNDFSTQPLNAVIVNTTPDRTASVVVQDDLNDVQPSSVPIATVTY